MWAISSSPLTPTRPRKMIIARRPTLLLNKLVKDVDLSEVGQRLASEFHHLFGGSSRDRDRGAEPSANDTAIVIPQVQVQTREELDLDDDDDDDVQIAAEQELSLTSPFIDHHQHFLPPPHLTDSPISTPLLSPTLSLSPSSSTDSLISLTPSLSDPYHSRSQLITASESSELDALRAASARCVYHLPPQPHFRELKDIKKRVSRSSEEMRPRSSASAGRRQAERRTGSVDAQDFARLLAQKKWGNGGTQDRRASGSTAASERPLRSVRSFITTSSSTPSTPLTPPPPPTPLLPYIVSQKALCSGLGLDFAERSVVVVQRQPSPPPSPRGLQPRSSAGSLVGF